MRLLFVRFNKAVKQYKYIYKEGYGNEKNEKNSSSFNACEFCFLHVSTGVCIAW